MSDVGYGVLAVLVGLYLCLRGQWALRILIAIWGAFVGFSLGAGLVSAVTGEGFLASALGWLVGVVLAVIFSGLAYLYYVVGIVLGIAGMGFVLGGTLASALGATSPWISVLVGAVSGVVLAIFAVTADLPQFILIVLSALTGASLLISGIMLLAGVVRNVDVIDGSVTLASHPWWYVSFLVVAVASIIVQLRWIPSVRAPVRDTWKST